MKKTELTLLDAVVLTGDLPELGLVAGQVGTIVEELAPSVYEVEFSDDEGKTYAIASVKGKMLITLHYGPVAA